MNQTERPTWDNLTKAQQEQLKQIFRQGMVNDHNLISRQEAKKLAELGITGRFEGYNFVERLPMGFPRDFP